MSVSEAAHSTRGLQSNVASPLPSTSPALGLCIVQIRGAMLGKNALAGLWAAATAWEPGGSGRSAAAAQLPLAHLHMLEFHISYISSCIRFPTL